MRVNETTRLTTALINSGAVLAIALIGVLVLAAVAGVAIVLRCAPALDAFG
jgi:hypothetical protein